MKYISIDVAIGMSEARALDARRLALHEAAMALLFPAETERRRLGQARSSPIDYRTNLYNTARIGAILLEAVRSAKSVAAPDAVLLDFSVNPTIRDPLLLALTGAISEVCKNALCSTFVVLLPTWISRESASWVQFNAIAKALQTEKFLLIVVANSGDGHAFTATEYKLPSSLREDYRRAVFENTESPQVRLEKRCVRRLGHFRDSPAMTAASKCRHYSYAMYDCENELYYLLRDWWAQHASSARAIVFDLKNNVSFKNAVKAFGTRMGVVTARVEDVLRNADVAREIKRAGQALLVVDVAQSGMTVQGHVAQLQHVGISVATQVLAAINKGGAKVTKADGIEIHGLVMRGHDQIAHPCVQCNLGLPFTDESHEEYRHLRTFDFLHMAEECGWEPEPEAPVNVGQAYRMVPKFSRMIELYGDYIRYKLYLALRQWSFPDDWFVVHPDEPDSTALCESLQIAFDGRLTAVRIPRETAIIKAQAVGNSWEQVLPELSSETPWMQQLGSMAGQEDRGALILDIFNGSGSTFRSLEALLYHFRIELEGYICLVDFDPEGINTGAIQVPRYSLYEMYNPRVLLEQQKGRGQS